MKKSIVVVISILLSFVILFNLVANNISFAQITFSDIDSSHWAYEYVTSLTNLGVIKGYDDGTYRPSKKITRAEFFKLITCAIENENVFNNIKEYVDEELYNDTINGYSNVTEQWYFPYVMYAINAGFLTDAANLSNINEPITRIEMAVAIARAHMLKTQNINLNSSNSEEKINISNDEQGENIEVDDDSEYEFEFINGILYKYQIVNGEKKLISSEEIDLDSFYSDEENTYIEDDNSSVANNSNTTKKSSDSSNRDIFKDDIKDDKDVDIKQIRKEYQETFDEAGYDFDFSKMDLEEINELLMTIDHDEFNNVMKNSKYFSKYFTDSSDETVLLNDVESIGNALIKLGKITEEQYKNMTDNEIVSEYEKLIGTIDYDRFYDYYAVFHKNFDEEKMIEELGEITDTSILSNLKDENGNPIEGSAFYKFTDLDKLNDVELMYVAYVSDIGIISGYDDGTFKPYNELTRAEVATIIYRLRNLLSK